MLWIFWLGLVNFAQASTVCASTCTYTTLSAAYSAASPGDTITVEDSRTYVESITATKSVTFEVGTSASPEWEGNGSAGEVLKVKSASTVIVDGFTVTPGKNRAFQVEGSSKLTLKNVTVDTYSASGHDGVGLKVKSGSNAVVEDSSFNYLTGRNGAAVFVESASTATLTRVSMTGNTAGTSGAALYVNDSTVTMTDVTLNTSGSVDSGGAIYVDNSVLTATLLTSTGNASGDHGGFLYAIDGTITLTETTVTSSLSQNHGGSIYVEDSDLTVVDSIFGTSLMSNGSQNGGHLYGLVSSGSHAVTLSETAFSDGTATNKGGSIFLDGMNFTMTGGSVTSSIAGDDGGGVYVQDTDDPVLSDVLFSLNTAGDDGGGVMFSNITNAGGTGSAEVDQCRFTFNVAADHAGGLRVQNSDEIVLTNTSFENNDAANSGGGVYILNTDMATFEGNEFFSNTASRGGGTRLISVPDVSVLRDHYCDNSTDGTIGGAVLLSDGGEVSSVWTNTIFNENIANTAGGALYADNHDIELRNNLFLTNDATDGGAIYLDESDYSLINTVVAWSVGGDGIDANWLTGGTYSMDYNNWYLNTTSNYAGSLGSSSLGSNSIFVDPDLEDYTADGDCTNDKLWPASTSALIDAGDPNTAYNDPDGTRSDIGAYGGPDADPDLFTDADGDGYAAISDCDDGDANINPGETEVCDAANVDENCNGVADDDDSGVDVTTQTSWYEDGDEDGYGDEFGTPVSSCDNPSDATTRYESTNTDCNDARSDVSPGATEICDAADVDEDCDGLSDDDDASVDVSTQTSWYLDGDADTFGDASGTPTLACDDPSTSVFVYVTDNSDCNDSLNSVNPLATEGPGDEIDQNCDGLETCYVDGDDDTYRGSGTVASIDTDCSDSGEATDTDPTGDCNDSDSATYPGADEYCDGVDTDCDGVLDESDALDAPTWYADTDSDTYGDSSVTQKSCTQPTGYVATDGDCDDLKSAVYPGADEYCDGVDSDCDGTLDEDDALDALTWYADTDADSYGDLSSTKKACYKTTGWVSDNTDCDDLEVTTYPGADEYCDTVDNDCDGTIDEDDALDAVTWYIDSDTDTYGSPAMSTVACAQPTGYADNDSDCNDADSAINPGATEVCDVADVDEDCDMLSDDLDTSTDPTTKFSWYPDADEDTYGDSSSSEKLACDDPSTTMDTFVLSNTDCDDADKAVNPGATEVCDSIDNDCDGTIDEPDASGAPTWYLDEDGDDFGVADDTTIACDEPKGYAEFDGDCDDGNNLVYPSATELCDDIDNDCDDVIDEDVEYVPWYPDSDGDTFGAAEGSIEDCAPIDGYVLNDTDCDDTVAEINPDADEIWYDGVDQNCDDWNDYDQDFDTFISDEYGGDDCDDTVAEINPDADEIWYDGVDQDCDGESDFDQDQDGYDSAEFDGEDCDDESSSINPGVDEVLDNMVDEDCDDVLGWSPDDIRSWDNDDIEGPSSGCDCSVATTPTPWLHGLWLSVGALFSLRRRQR